ncbi:hypothetical protein QFZ30_003929 [Arthrobacter pascens]|nr:hypothetical protein [Arthrobacter pascens]
MIRQPWVFAAVCVMVLALTLLLFGWRPFSLIQLLPGYIAAYLLIGACIFAPLGKLPSVRQAVAFLLPGAVCGSIPGAGGGQGPGLLMGLSSATLMVCPGASSPVGRSAKSYQAPAVPVLGRLAERRSLTPKRNETCRSMSPGAVV